MAGFALNLGMFAAEQREACGFVVEFRLFPDFIVVAAFALLAQCAFVYIIFFVACVALLGSLAKFFLGFVAVLALHFWIGMCAL